MKKFLAIAGLFILTTSLQAQEKKAYTVDFKDPKSVVSALFYAAQNNDLSILGGLCDPHKENDGDTRRICALAALSTTSIKTNVDKDLHAFLSAFKNAKIDGDVELLRKGDQEGARVPIVFNHPKKGMEKETILLIKRNGQFYLASM